MGLQTTWFILIALLWTAFFVLEGFDFGVGMLTPLLAADDTERKILKSTTGPFWDGNEVWLLTAGAAMFAAFPDWYASMFQAYYLPLFAVVASLILRAVGTEFRDRREDASWQHTWDWLIAGGCLIVPLFAGVAFGGLLNGIPLNAQHDFTGNLLDLLAPYALCTGLTFAAMALFQGLLFVRLRTEGALAERAAHWAVRVGAAVVVLLVVFTIWTQAAADKGLIPGAGAWLALTFAVAALAVAGNPKHPGWAFASSTAAIAFTVLGFFGTLHPFLIVSSTNLANSVTVSDSSGQYTLTLMTIVVAVMLPVVLAYTAWNYWVFRARVTAADVGAVPQLPRILTGAPASASAGEADVTPAGGDADADGADESGA